MVLITVAEGRLATKCQRQKLARGAPRGAARQEKEESDRIQQCPSDRSSDLQSNPRDEPIPEYGATLSLCSPSVMDPSVLGGQDDLPYDDYISASQTPESNDEASHCDFNFRILLRP